MIPEVPKTERQNKTPTPPKTTKQQQEQKPLKQINKQTKSHGQPVPEGNKFTNWQVEHHETENLSPSKEKAQMLQWEKQ